MIPPRDPIDAMRAISLQDDAGLRHVRHCPGCRVAWYRAGGFPAGCTDPRHRLTVLGAIGLGALPTAALDHVERCLACRLLVLAGARSASGQPAGGSTHR